jgi:hypothetical protein
VKASLSPRRFHSASSRTLARSCNSSSVAALAFGDTGPLLLLEGDGLHRVVGGLLQQPEHVVAVHYGLRGLIKDRQDALVVLATVLYALGRHLRWGELLDGVI